MNSPALVTAILVACAFQSQVLAADSGKQVYEKTCIVCHGDDGTGAMPGVHDITGKNGPLAQTDAILRKHVMEGFQSPGSPMGMPPKGGNPELTDQQLRDVLKYLRRTFLP